jgi:HNH endonuclease
MKRKNWTRRDLVVAFNLYCRTPFGKIHNRNPEIIALADALGRSSSALSWKLANFARFDPALKKRAISGASHGNKLELEVWEEFSHDWEALSFESELILSELLTKTPSVELDESFPTGITRDALVRVRVNQGFFRSAVLAAYDCRCCITGLAVAELLCASHIVPWSVDHTNRTNPANGLCLNALHDRAFDRGLLTIDQNYCVRLSRSLAAHKDDAAVRFMEAYEGKQILLPKRFQPGLSFLGYHTSNIYQAG